MASEQITHSQEHYKFEQRSFIRQHQHFLAENLDIGSHIVALSRLTSDVIKGEEPYHIVTPELVRFVARKALGIAMFKEEDEVFPGDLEEYRTAIGGLLRAVRLRNIYQDRQLDIADAFVPPGSAEVQGGLRDPLRLFSLCIDEGLWNDKLSPLVSQVRLHALLRTAIASPDEAERQEAQQAIFTGDDAALASFSPSKEQRFGMTPQQAFDAAFAFVDSYRRRADGSFPLGEDVASAADGLLDKLLAWGDAQVANKAVVASPGSGACPSCCEGQGSPAALSARQAALEEGSPSGISGRPAVSAATERQEPKVLEAPQPQAPAWIGTPPPLLAMQDALWKVARNPETYLPSFLQGLSERWKAPDANDETRLCCLKQVRTVLNAEPDRLRAVPELLATVAGMAASVPLATQEERDSPVAAGLAWLLDQMVATADPAHVVGHLVPLDSLDEDGDQGRRVTATAETLATFSRAYGGSARLEDCAHKLKAAELIRRAITGNEAARVGINRELQALDIILPQGVRKHADLGRRGVNKDDPARLKRAQTAQHMAIFWAKRYAAYEAPQAGLRQEKALGGTILLERQRKIRANATSLLKQAGEAQRVWGEFAANLAVSSPSAQDGAVPAARGGTSAGRPQPRGRRDGALGCFPET